METKNVLAILTFILLSGCTLQLPSSGYGKNVNIAETHTGIEGVVTSFVENTLPSEILENQWFEFAFSLENKGAVDVQNGIYVIGVPDDLETRDETYSRFNLKGKSMFNPFGDSQFYKIKIRGRELGAQLERVESSLSVDVCYPYKTEFSGFVCINPEPAIKSSQARVCTPSSQSFSGQGAPVAVTFVDTPQIVPNDNPALINPIITLRVKNIGKGIVVSKNKFGDACIQKASADLYNLVQISGTLSDVPLVCSPQQLHLSEGDTTVVCTLDGGLEKSRGIYSANLKLNLDYGYLSKKTRKVIIKQLP